MLCLFDTSLLLYRYPININCHPKYEMNRNLKLSLHCEHRLRPLRLFVFRDLLDLIVLISVSLITCQHPFLLSVTYLIPFLPSPLSVFVFPPSPHLPLWLGCLSYHQPCKLAQMEIIQALNASSHVFCGISASKQLLPVSVHNYYYLRILYSNWSLSL